MITKDLFISSINAIKRFEEYENKLADLNIDLWERDEIQDFEFALVNLLSYACKDVHEPSSFDPNTLEYFIWETNYGSDAADFPITGNNGKDYILDTPEKLWDYFVEQNPEIEDKESNEWDSYKL